MEYETSSTAGHRDGSREILAKAGIVVIGAGPVGAMVARTAAQTGAQVCLLEEDAQPGRPVQCTGLVSPRTLKEASVDRDVVVREVTGVSISAPNGRTVVIDGQGLRALVIDREAFDLALVRQAVAAGAVLKTGLQAKGFQRDVKGHVGGVLVCDRASGTPLGAIEARVVVGADGPDSKVRKWAGLPAPTKTLYGIQVVAHFVPENDRFVGVFLGRGIAPGFFAWMVPSRPGLARIGLATDQQAFLQRGLKRLLDLLELHGGIVEKQGGAIPIGPSSSTVKNNVLIVGDAAGQAKPTSGGGLYTGLVCAKIAGEIAAQACREDDATVLREYDALWRERLGTELQVGMMAHRMLAHMPDRTVDRLLAALDRPELLREVAAHGDMDYPSQLLRHVLRQPRLWARFGKFLATRPIVGAAAEVTSDE